ncbi:MULTISPECIES: hypothetical protein [Xanthobacter]|uniref:hypothetical protein n=1 Tax=Xanthobacter TaxID=279 RepID=UPI0024AD25AA|nr:hypothetical protein [Xanthobacter autotrophicus]
MARRRSPSCRRPRRRAVTIPFETLLAGDPELQRYHARCTGNGMSLRTPRLWSRRDGSFTARFEWCRHDGANTTSIVYTCTYVREAAAQP